MGRRQRPKYLRYLDEDDRKKLSVHYEKFEEYVKPRTYVIYNMYRFQTRIQADTEANDQFVTELKLMVRKRLQL